MPSKKIRARVHKAKKAAAMELQEQQQPQQLATVQSTEDLATPAAQQQTERRAADAPSPTHQYSQHPATTSEPEATATATTSSSCEPTDSSSQNDARSCHTSSPIMEQRHELEGVAGATPKSMHMRMQQAAKQKNDERTYVSLTVNLLLGVYGTIEACTPRRVLPVISAGVGAAVHVAAAVSALAQIRISA